MALPTFTAGKKLRASELAAVVSQVNLIQPKTYEAFQTGNVGNAQTLTNALADSLNATITFTTLTASAVAVVVFEVDCNITVANAGNIIIGELNIDGVDDTNRQALMSMDDVHRVTIGQRYRKVLGAAGSHTIKLRIQKTGAGGTATAVDGHTGLTVVVYENA